MNAGTPKKPVWLPPELLFIVKGQRRLKLDERQVRSLPKRYSVRHLRCEQGEHDAGMSSL